MDGVRNSGKVAGSVGIVIRQINNLGGVESVGGGGVFCGHAKIKDRVKSFDLWMIKFGEVADEELGSTTGEAKICLFGTSLNEVEVP